LKPLILPQQKQNTGGNAGIVIPKEDQIAIMLKKIIVQR
jgi:hypothetical protein